MGRRWLTVVVVCLASTGAGVTALASLRLDRELSVGTVRIFSDPGHHGALDLYVPLVDWGVRFGGVRAPVRLRVDVQRVDRDAAVSLAREGAGSPRVLARVKRDARDVALAEDLVRQDREINRLNREIFQLAIEIGDDPDTREWAMHMTMVARALERVGDNAVDIGEVTAFVVSGLFREFSDSSLPTLT